MDALAADVAIQFLHDQEGVENVYYVTAAVDDVILLRTPSAKHDMKI